MIYEDRTNIAYPQWETIQEIADTVGEATLAEQLDDDPVRQALFVNGVEVATRTGLENKRRMRLFAAEQPETTLNEVRSATLQARGYGLPIPSPPRQFDGSAADPGARRIHLPWLLSRCY